MHAFFCLTVQSQSDDESLSDVLASGYSAKLDVECMQMVEILFWLYRLDHHECFSIDENVV